MTTALTSLTQWWGKPTGFYVLHDLQPRKALSARRSDRGRHSSTFQSREKAVQTGTPQR